MPTLVTVTLPHQSGLPEDRVIHDFAFNLDATNASIRSDIGIALNNFYGTDQGHAPYTSVSALIAPCIDRGAPWVTSYYNLAGHLDGSDHGSPVAMGTLASPDAAEDAGLPSEVAVALSMHANLTGVLESAPNPTPPPATIRPAARRRGRIFIGPLCVDTVGYDANDRPEVAVEVRQTIGDAASDLLAAITSGYGSTATWSVWSRSDAAMYPIVGGYVDDAFDTQRRRGEASTARTTWS